MIPKGISDDYLFAEAYNIGIVIEDMNTLSMKNTVEKIDIWLNQNHKPAVVKRCREFVESDRSIENYQALFSDI